MQVSLSSQSRGISRFYLSIISLSMNAQILSHYHLILSRGPNLISLSSHSQKMPKSYLSIISLSINAQILSHYHITLMRWDCLMIQSHIKSEFMRQSISRDNPLRLIGLGFQVWHIGSILNLAGKILGRGCPVYINDVNFRGGG